MSYTYKNKFFIHENWLKMRRIGVYGGIIHFNLKYIVKIYISDFDGDLSLSAVIKLLHLRVYGENIYRVWRLVRKANK